MAPINNYTPTTSEFEALPPTLQRKYFSTLERLRYAEAQAKAGRQLSVANNSYQRTSSEKLISKKSISRLQETIRPSKLISTSISTSVTLPGSAYTIEYATQEDALWFSRLPDKVKRGYFSIEEERFLNARKDNLFLNDLNFASTKNPYKQGESTNRSLPSVQDSTSISNESIWETIDTEEEEEDYDEDFDDDYEDDDDMDAELMSQMSWTDTDLDLSLDDYHKKLLESQMSTALRSSSAFSSVLSIRKPRTNTIHTERPYQEELQASPLFKTTPEKKLLEWGAGWSPVTTSFPPVPEIPECTDKVTAQTVHTRKASAVSLSIRKVSSQNVRTINTAAPSVKQDRSQAPVTIDRWALGPAKLPTPPESPIIETPATHYLDPEARLKLRVYLASASKFDEALEFGFPSLVPSDESDAASIPPKASNSIRRKPIPAAKTAIMDLGISTGYTSRSVSDSYAVVPSPSTSQFHAIPYNAVSQIYPEPSLDRKTALQSQILKVDRDPYVNGTGREMTIRMTLTRPDLRADSPTSHQDKQFVVRPRTGPAYFEEYDPLTVDFPRYDLPASPASSHKLSSFKKFWQRK